MGTWDFKLEYFIFKLNILKIYMVISLTYYI